MRPGIFYLPEYHNFSYIGIAPWPHLTTEQQLDWVDSVNTLELWLNRYVGPHYSEWAFSNYQDLEYWQACIAFKREKYKTLFLLTWS